MYLLKWKSGSTCYRSVGRCWQGLTQIGFWREKTTEVDKLLSW